MVDASGQDPQPHARDHLHCRAAPRLPAPHLHQRRASWANGRGGGRGWAAARCGS